MVGDVGAVGVGGDDLGGGFRAGRLVGAGLGPQVGFGLAEGVGDGEAVALVGDAAGEPPGDGLDVDTDGCGEGGRVKNDPGQSRGRAYALQTYGPARTPPTPYIAINRCNAQRDGNPDGNPCQRPPTWANRSSLSAVGRGY